MCVRMCVYVCVHVYICDCAFVCEHISVCMCVLWCVCMCVYVCVYIYSGLQRNSGRIGAVLVVQLTTVRVEIVMQLLLVPWDGVSNIPDPANHKRLRRQSHSERTKIGWT